MNASDQPYSSPSANPATAPSFPPGGQDPAGTPPDGKSPDSAESGDAAGGYTGAVTPKPLTLLTLQEFLLRDWRGLMWHFQHTPKTPWMVLLGSCLNFAIFGIVVGTIPMGWQLAIVPLKIILGVYFSCLITLPSLYIFSALGGINITPGQLCALVLSMVGVVALLLTGLTPVLWIFGQSTDSLLFLGPLHLGIWTVALYFGLRSMKQALSFAKSEGQSSGEVLGPWGFVFLLVLMQMGTSLRPLLSEAATFFPAEKMFFLDHWFSVFR